MQAFLNYLKKFSGRVLILSHQNSDLDAISSSIALKEALGILNPGLTIMIGAAGSICKSAKQVLKEFSEEAVINPKLDVQLIILVDTATLQQIAPLDTEIKKHAGKIAVIDHHASHADTRDIADFYFVDERASSSSEIVYTILKKMKLKISGRIGFALLIGILADSAHLKFATKKTIKIVNEILEKTNADYERAASLLEVSEDVSRKIAHLKAAQRMELYRVMDFVLVTSEVNSFGASAARALVLLGADCAFVGSIRKNEIQISARASSNFIKETGISLGRDIMPKIGEFINGSGGGHAGAAGAKGRGDSVSNALLECIKLVQEFLHAPMKK